MKNRMWENQFRTTRLCVDSYDDGVLSGRLSNPMWESVRPFKSLTQFLILMEQILDDTDFPQPYNITRNFAPAKELPGENCVSDPDARGKLMTFNIQILFRQHASWQGCATWVEEQKMQCFRSVLELVLLMDSALRSDIS